MSIEPYEEEVIEYILYKFAFEINFCKKNRNKILQKKYFLFF